MIVKDILLYNYAEIIKNRRADLMDFTTTLVLVLLHQIKISDETNIRIYLSPSSIVNPKPGIRETESEKATLVCQDNSVV